MSERKRKLDLDDAADAKREKATVSGGPDMDDPSGGVNPYTGKAYSQKYYEILSKRRGEADARCEGEGHTWRRGARGMLERRARARAAKCKRQTPAAHA